MNRRRTDYLIEALNDLEFQKRALEKWNTAGTTEVRSGTKDAALKVFRTVNAHYPGLVPVPTDSDLGERHDPSGHLFTTQSLITHIEMAMHRIARRLGARLRDTSMWRNGYRTRVLIGYSKREGLRYAKRLRRALEVHGIDAFVAKESIEPSKEWALTLASALATCDACVPILTGDFRTSECTAQELGYCLQRGIPIVAVKRGADPFGFIQFLQALD